MRLNKILNPLRRLLTELGLELDFKHTVLEDFLVLFGHLIEREVDANVGATPIVPRARTTIPVVFPNHREFSIKRDSHTCVSRELEGSSVVKGAHD